LAGVLCLLLLGFAGASYGAVRWDVVPSPTEVINTGRSEVTGSVTLIVRGAPGTNVTGTATGGAAQIGLIYTNPAMQIDNTTTSGIKLFYSTNFVFAFTSTGSSGTVGITQVENRDINGRCSGFITVNMAPGAGNPAIGQPALIDGLDYIRVEGVRGRIDASLAVTPGTDLFVDLQSINDPAANQFNPDRVRIAKSLDGMNVGITSDTLLLCFPTTGRPNNGTAIPNYQIRITEGFARAFVDLDANNDGSLVNDRVDSGGFVTNGSTPAFAQPAALGAPTNSTQFVIWMEGIPTSVSGIIWADQYATTSGTGALLRRVTSTFDATSGTAMATYSYESTNQTGFSDIVVESFTMNPIVVLKVGATTVGNILAAVSLAPTTSAASGCAAPSATPSRPRFLQMYESDAIATNNPPDDPHKLYAQVIRCNCYMLFTYVTTENGYNTGIAVANTTGDTAPFGANEAADQLGKITFYYYDKTAGYVGSFTTANDVTSGRSFIDVASSILPTGVTKFTGYIIAKAEFQYCHAFAFIADSAFANLAQGYLANIIPDPAIKGAGAGRTASDAGDITNLPAGEGLNN